MVGVDAEWVVAQAYRIEDPIERADQMSMAVTDTAGLISVILIDLPLNEMKNPEVPLTLGSLLKLSIQLCTTVRIKSPHR